MVWVGLAYNSMPALSGWQEELTVSLQHVGQVITNALSWIPNWAGIAIFLMLLGLLAWYAFRQIGRGKDTHESEQEQEEVVTTPTPSTESLKEEPVEY
jgi:type II secretory pathway component PulF